MNLFLHTFYTWIVAILLLVVGLTGYTFLSSALYGQAGWFAPDLFSTLFFIMVAGSPSFLIAWALLFCITTSGFASSEKFFLWILAAVASIVMNLILLLLVFADEILDLETLLYFWPAYLAAIVAIGFRVKQFFFLIHKTINDGNL